MKSHEAVETSNQKTKENLSSVSIMYQGGKYYDTLDEICSLYV